MSKKNWYDKYFGKTTKKSSHHSFWSDEFQTDYSSPIYKESLSEAQIDTLKTYKLSSARKAIGNFVTIATGKQIPVTFQSNQSYTDGKSVVISGDIDEVEKFDVGVGLALHEGSHILLSDFELLQNLGSHIPKELCDKGTEKGDNPMGTIKNILNVVEDRRIDAYIYKNAPGYREYYLKLYEKYFGDNVISEALNSDEWRSETIENYMNRLINLMNPSTSITALKGLKAIWECLDLKNIGRLTTTAQSLEVALQIYGIILSNVPTALGKKSGGENGENGESGKSNGQSPDFGDEGNDRGGDSIDSEGEGEGEDGDGDGEEGESKSSNGKPSNKSSQSESLSASKKNKLNKVLSEQKKFLDGDTKKKRLTKKMVDEIDSVDVSGGELVHVGDSLVDRRGNKMKGVDVVLYKTLTKQMMLDGHIKLSRPSTDKNGVRYLRQVMSEESYNTAENMGNQLAKKLQVRNEARTTVFNRQRNGKIDKRLLHSLGFDAEGVFTQMFVDKYKKANIHLSIDASSSMTGSKWNKTIVNTMAMAKAVSKISNLSMQISIRYSDDKLPIVIVAWDSRKDSYKKVQTIFPYLSAYGTTPEGLCFEALSKLIVPATSDMDSYFVNISDGEPCFNTGKMEYVGTMAFQHTKAEIEKIRKMGIGVLSYYVAEHGVRVNENFKTMYGTSSRFVDINSIGEVTKTMNQLFLSKKEVNV